MIKICNFAFFVTTFSRGGKKNNEGFRLRKNDNDDDKLCNNKSYALKKKFLSKSFTKENC